MYWRFVQHFNFHLQSAYSHSRCCKYTYCFIFIFHPYLYCWIRHFIFCYHILVIARASHFLINVFFVSSVCNYKKITKGNKGAASNSVSIGRKQKWIYHYYTTVILWPMSNLNMEPVISPKLQYTVEDNIDFFFKKEIV